MAIFLLEAGMAGILLLNVAFMLPPGVQSVGCDVLGILLPNGGM